VKPGGWFRDFVYATRISVAAVSSLGERHCGFVGHGLQDVGHARIRANEAYPVLDTSKENSHSSADLETDLETRVTPAHGGVKAEYRSPDLRFG
jgi:hypothetical protein